MILVIVNKETNEITGRVEEIVSHGINLDTDEIIIMPPVSPMLVGAKYDISLGEFVIHDSKI